jgi:hypothetical protein
VKAVWGRLLCAVLLAGCGTGSLRTAPASRPFPDQVFPSSVDGLKLQLEPSAQRAFAGVGASSTVSRGKLWSLRQGREVVASVQLSQLKDGLSTAHDAVRAGVRSAIGNGHYRWFKLADGQWVGVQEHRGLSLYLWFPRRHDLFVVAQVASKEPDPDGLVTALVTSAREIS